MGFYSMIACALNWIGKSNTFSADYRAHPVWGSTRPYLHRAFTVNHAASVLEGIDGFLDQLRLARCEEVQLADEEVRTSKQ
jgi:hypothetical protein